MIAARHATLRAGIAALEGRSADALTLYQDALAGWRAAHAGWDEALTGHGRRAVARSVRSGGCRDHRLDAEILERLGAKPYLDRLNQAEAAATSKPASGARTPAKAEVAVTE